MLERVEKNCASRWSFIKYDHELRHVSTSVLNEQLGSHWQDFVKFCPGDLYYNLSNPNFVKNNFKNNRNFTRKPTYISLTGPYNADNVPCAVREESEETVDDLQLRTMHE